MKIVTGHQPVYLPWLGLIHKASLGDIFVYMDDVQYLEQDWNNRNKIKTSQGQPKWLSVPVDLKASPSRALKDILISTEPQISETKKWQKIHWASLQASYGKTPYFKDYRPFFEWLYLEKKWERLSDLNLAILKQVFEWFQIKTEVAIASEHSFVGQKSDLVLEHAKKFQAKLIVTGTLGRDYIKIEDFKAAGVQVYFQDYQHPIYEQKFGDFVSHLSFVDLLFQAGPSSRSICLEKNMTKEELCRLHS